MPSLGGHLFVARGIELDYSFLEATESLLPVCDKVAITLFTDEDENAFKEKFGDNPKIIRLRKELPDFDNMKGKERLNYWTNWTKDHLDTDWQFSIQADEILHEDCYDAVRALVDAAKHEAYIIQRRSTWGDPYHYINYPKLIAEGRGGELPCSEYVGRLAKIKYNSCGDAESLDAPFCADYRDQIRLFHSGFIRDKRKKTAHIQRIQRHVFDLGYNDPRTDADIAENNGLFRPYTRFSKDDLLPATEPLPKVIQRWALERNK